LFAIGTKEPVQHPEEPFETEFFHILMIDIFSNELTAAEQSERQPITYNDNRDVHQGSWPCGSIDTKRSLKTIGTQVNHSCNNGEQ
jgi:hypothetical protein